MQEFLRTIKLSQKLHTRYLNLDTENHPVILMGQFLYVLRIMLVNAVVTIWSPGHTNSLDIT